MRTRLSVLLPTCFLIVHFVWGEPRLAGNTAFVNSTRDFLLCFSPGWVHAVDTVVVENHLSFGGLDYPRYTVNKANMTITGTREHSKPWELRMPDRSPVLTFAGATVLHVVGLQIQGVEHGTWFGNETGLWMAVDDAKIVYRSCSILLDSSAFATMMSFHSEDWKVSKNSIYVPQTQSGSLTYIDVFFSKQEITGGQIAEVVNVRHPSDLTWLEWMQKQTPKKLEVHLFVDMVIDACAVSTAMGGARGPIPIRRPTIIKGSESILSISKDVLPDGFLRVYQQPLVIEETSIDLQDMVIWPGDECQGLACPSGNATIILPSYQDDCLFSMTKSSIVMPRGFLANLPSREWMIQGRGYAYNDADIEVKIEDTVDASSLQQFMYSGMCLEETHIDGKLYRDFIHGFIGVECSDHKLLTGKKLGTIEITIVSALGFGIVLVALCLAALCTVGNKLKSGEGFGQKIKFGFKTGSSSEGLPDSIVVSPDPEMGTYAPHIDMDFKLVLDQAPMWILEEIFNQSNYDRDSSIVMGERIAAGGYGVVFKGTWKGIPVAIKTVLFQDRGHKELQQNKDKARAIVEAAISSSVAHPNIVQTYAFSFKRVSKRAEEKEKHESLEPIGTNSRKQKHYPRQTHWKLYMVQELCDAGSLNAAIAKSAFMDSTNNPCLSYILQIALDAGRGVMHLHRHNIVHGDLSTRNILLQKRTVQKDGVKLTAKIADFGLSQKLDKCQNHIANHWAGTPFYMAPEVVQSGHLSKAADVFSFGVVMWELYHSMECFLEKEDVPNESDDRFQYHPLFPKFPTSCPISLVMLCVSCLSPDPDDRPDFPLVCKALSSLQSREKKGHYSSPAAIQASNKETSQAMGRMNSNQIVDIVAMLLAIDSQRSVRSRSMDIAQTSVTGTHLPSLAFYMPTEIQVSLNQATTTHCANISSQSRDADSEWPPYSAFNYSEAEAKHATLVKPTIPEAPELCTQPEQSHGKLQICVDDLDDGLAPWSLDADDMDDAERGLGSPADNIEAESQPASRVGIGITVSQRVRNQGSHNRKSSRRERQWEMDGGVLTGVEPTSRTVDEISSLPYVSVLPTLREEITPEGQEERRDESRGMEPIPCASAIFLSTSGDV